MSVSMSETTWFSSKMRKTGKQGANNSPNSKTQFTHPGKRLAQYKEHGESNFSHAVVLVDMQLNVDGNRQGNRDLENELHKPTTDLRQAEDDPKSDKERPPTSKGASLCQKYTAYATWKPVLGLAPTVLRDGAHHALGWVPHTWVRAPLILTEAPITRYLPNRLWVVTQRKVGFAPTRHPSYFPHLGVSMSCVRLLRRPHYASGSQRPATIWAVAIKRHPANCTGTEEGTASDVACSQATASRQDAIAISLDPREVQGPLCSSDRASRRT